MYNSFAHFLVSELKIYNQTSEYVFMPLIVWLPQTIIIAVQYLKNTTTGMKVCIVLADFILVLPALKICFFSLIWSILDVWIDPIYLHLKNMDVKLEFEWKWLHIWHLHHILLLSIYIKSRYTPCTPFPLSDNATNSGYG